MHPAPQSCALILAAGLSIRMGGRPKALCLLQGYSFLEHCLQLFRQAGIGQCVVVTGHEQEAIAGHARNIERQLSGITVKTAYNTQFEQGMFSSIQTGLAAVQTLFPKARGCFLLPVDAPLVAPNTVRELYNHWKTLPNPDANIILPACAGQTGHPPIIGRAHFTPVLACPAALGLRAYMASLLDATQAKALLSGQEVRTGPATLLSCISVQDDNITCDIDTPVVLAQAERRHVGHFPWP